MAQAGMGSVPVVFVQPASKLVAPLFGVLISAGVGPLLERGADEALSLSVGTRCVGPGEAVFDAEPLAHAGEQSRAVGRSVVGQQSAEADAESRVILQSLS